MGGRTEGVVEQVRDRLAAFLGAPEAFKKELTRMYGFRSQLVHGGLDLPVLESRAQQDEFWDRLSHSESVALAVVLASLQELIRRDWDSLQFHTTAIQ